MRRTVWKTMFKGLFALIFVWMVIGCAYQPKPSPPKSPPPLASEAESEPAVKAKIPVLKKPMPFPPKSPPPLASEAESEPAVKAKIPVLKKPMPLEQMPEFYVHKVRWVGETISVIAQWYTGNHNNWKRIVKVNADIDPKRMEIGDKILIPEALLKTSEPMPQKYIGTSVRKKEAPSPSRGKPALESDKEEVVEAPETDRQTGGLVEIELFQPQDIEQTVAEPEEVELFKPVE